MHLFDLRDSLNFLFDGSDIFQSDEWKTGTAKIKKDLIKDLVMNGYVDVPEDADIGALVGA